MRKQMLCLVIGLLIVFLAPIASFAEENVEKKDTDFNVYWKEGIKFDSNDGKFKLAFGGRFMTDVLFASGNDALEADVGEFENGIEVRRGRLEVSGAIYDKVKFKTEYDFAGGESNLKDAYLELSQVFGNGSIRIGHFKEPFMLDELISSKYTTFLETSTATTFASGENMGIMFYGYPEDKNSSWAIGYFRNTDDFGFDANSASSIAGRVTFAPGYVKGEKAYHFGLGARRVDYTSTASARFRARPEVHNTHRLVDTGSFDADSAMSYGLEAAMTSGPFNAAAEYVMCNVSTPGSDDPNFNSYYVYASYFLTGENRPYKPESGVFDRVKPIANFGSEEGDGAWEIAGRYSVIDLDSGSITGGKLTDITLGLNWYLNPNTKMMLNYTDADKSGVGSARFIQLRFHVDF